MKWHVCYTNLCNTEKSFCDKCELDKNLDVCTDDYSKPSQKTGEDEGDPETGTADNQSQVVTEDSKTDGEDTETGTGTVDNQSQVVTEASKEDHKDDASKSSNQLITHSWFLILLLSIVTNVVHF